MAINRSESHGDSDGILKVVGEDYFPPNFKEYMLMEQLKWSRHQLDSLGRSNCGWVFWSEQDHEIEPSLSLDNWADFNPNVCEIPKLEYNIRYALQKLIWLSSPKIHSCLVQFWAPTTLMGRTLLRTQYQPFALGPTYYEIDRQRLFEYRMKMCREHNFFYADAGSGEEQLGLPGRVFLHQFPESSPDVKYYSEKEYPQRDLALRYEIIESWAVPVFEHYSRTCVGVLEMVSLYNMSSYWHDESFVRHIDDIFQEFGLLCFDSYKHCEMQFRDDNIKARMAAFQELNMVLSSVCKIHELPLAMTWVPCSACIGLLRGQLLSEGVEFYEDRNIGLFDFLRVSKCSHLRKGGVSDRVLSSPYMLYCSDITQLSLAEYHLVHYARLYNFSGWFAICMLSSYTESEVYILEFFLPIASEGDENILTMSLILGTMKENFTTFKLASGQELGEILPVEVMDFRNGQKIHFVQTIQASTLSPSSELVKDRGLMLQPGQLDQPSINAIDCGMSVVSEKQNYILSSLEALQNGEATMQQDSPHQPPLDPSNNRQNAVLAERNMIVVTSLEEGTRKMQEREAKKAGVRIEISFEDILKCSQMSQNNAARELKVSQSTLKRVCRAYGFSHWPPRKINMVCSSWLPPVEDQNQSPEMSSDMASDQASVCVANTNLGHQDADISSSEKFPDMVAIKAKYGEYFVRFMLPSPPRLVQLKQEVGKRLNLEAETYYVKYKDEDDDLVVISCDEDLEECVRTSIFWGCNVIMLLLEPSSQKRYTLEENQKLLREKILQAQRCSKDKRSWELV